MKRKGLVFLGCLLTVPLCVRMLPGISADTMGTAVLAGAALGFAYLLLRPVLKTIALPVSCLTMGLSGFVIDCALILLMARIVPGFHVEGPEWAAFSALLVDGVCLIAGKGKR